MLRCTTGKMCRHPSRIKWSPHTECAAPTALLLHGRRAAHVRLAAGEGRALPAAAPPGSGQGHALDLDVELHGPGALSDEGPGRGLVREAARVDAVHLGEARRVAD